MLLALNYSDVKDPILPPDNVPCHKAKSVLNFLKEKKVQLLDWPAQSPDLNPIENLWKILRQRVMAKNPTNTEELWLKLQEEWSKIDTNLCKKLIESCSHQCAEEIKN